MGRGTDILDEALRHQVYLQRVASEVAERVRERVQNLTDQAIQLLDDAAEDLTGLDPDELDAMLAEAQDAQAQAMADALAELMPDLEKLAEHEAAYNAKALSLMTEGVRIKTVKASAAYEAALANPLAATGDLLETFIDDWSKKEVAAVNKLIRKGYAQGWTNEEMKRAVRGTKVAEYSDGLVAGIGWDADAVVRTSIMHVAGTARSELYARNSDVVVGEKFIATLERGTCPICRSLDGKEYAVGEGPIPPVHVCCRCMRIPVLAPEFAYLEEGATRSSEKGPAPASMTYYDWLKTQPAAFQDEALGPTRGQLFRGEGMTADKFNRLNMGRNFAPLTLEEMRRKEPGAFSRAGL